MMGKAFDEKIDVYAFGLIIWEVWTRGILFSDFEEYEPFVEAITKEHIRPPIPEDTPDSLSLLMSDCWSPDPKSRPSFKNITPRLDSITVDVVLPGNKYI